MRADGTNCDEELFYAFEKFGAAPQYVHVNQLRSKDRKLKAFQVLALPGGFAYGDDVVSGKILAVELVSYLKDELLGFIAKNGLIIGICNGFQVLVRTGLLPFGHFGKMEATLAQNDSGHFECRFVNLKTLKSRCTFLNSRNWKIGQFAVNHGEGKFFAPDKTIKKIEDEGLVVFKYVDTQGKPAQKYPQNPNGSTHSIAGICDPTGRILGLMPHPEKFVEVWQHPNWRRLSARGRIGEGDGAFIFEEMIKFAQSK